MQRRRGAKVAGLVAGLGLVLAACAPSNTPQSYDDPLVQQNFLEGCTNMFVDVTDDTTFTVTNDTIDDDASAVASTSDACRCMFQVYRDNVPYDDDAKADPQYAGYSGPTFTSLDSDLDTDNPADAFNSLPQDVRDRVSACQS
jgi:hypothetical protein